MASPLDDECDKKRAAIIAYGRMLADRGSHYLWGAEGQQPGEGACRLCKPVLDSAQPQKTSFSAAVYGGAVCVGRFRARDVVLMPPQQKVWDGASPAGRTAVLDFINRYKDKPNELLGWRGDELSPRLVTGYTDAAGFPNDYGGAGPLIGKIVWGEGCEVSQHFDCGGFVRWVTKEVTGVSIAGISGNPAALNSLGQPLGSLVKPGDPMLPADILVYPGHIAFADEGNGRYLVDSLYDIVQAEDAVSGVNYSKGGEANKRGGHTKCIRLSPSTLLNRRI